MPAASVARHTAYLLLWPGMDAAAFLAADRAVSINRPTRTECGMALLNIVVGFLLLRDVFELTKNCSPLLIGWSGMVGVMLILHFGVFQLLSGFWRANGIDAKPLMNQPIRSTSLADSATSVDWFRRDTITATNAMTTGTATTASPLSDVIV